MKAFLRKVFGQKGLEENNGENSFVRAESRSRGGDQMKTDRTNRTDRTDRTCGNGSAGRRPAVRSAAAWGRWAAVAALAAGVWVSGAREAEVA